MICVLDVDAVRAYVVSLSVRKYNGLSYWKEKETYEEWKEKKEWEEKEKQW